MKIFGGVSSRRVRDMRRPGKPQKIQKKRSVAKKIGIGFLVLLFALVSVAAVWLVRNVQPPSIIPPGGGGGGTVNNGTAIEGDTPIEEIDLNMGDRIDDFFTFVVCATDLDETRTDNIMVVAFDTKKHTVNVMNIPRDTMSNVSRTGASRKINAAYGTSKGIEQTKKQIKQVMGFTPDKYIVVNFKGIEEIVDAIGGVEYDIPFPMMYSDRYQDLNINFPVAGVQKLDGKEVVDFLRWRKNSPGYTHYVPKEYEHGDVTRIAKQQEFLMHLAKEVLTLKNAPKVKGIAEAVFRNVKTDITAGEMLWLAGQAFQVNTSDINMFTLPGYAASSTAGTDIEYSFYFVSQRSALSMINEHFNPYDKKITRLDLVSGPTKGTGKVADEDEEDATEIDDEDIEDETDPSEDPEGGTGTQDGGSSPGGSSGGNSGGSSGDPDDGTGGNSGNSGDSGGSGNNSGGSGDSDGSGDSGGNSGDSGGNSGDSDSPPPSPPPSPAPTDPEA